MIITTLRPRSSGGTFPSSGMDVLSSDECWLADEGKPLWIRKPKCRLELIGVLVSWILWGARAC